MSKIWKEGRRGSSPAARGGLGGHGGFRLHRVHLSNRQAVTGVRDQFGLDVRNQVVGASDRSHRRSHRIVERLVLADQLM